MRVRSRGCGLVCRRRLLTLPSRMLCVTRAQLMSTQPLWRGVGWKIGGSGLRTGVIETRFRHRTAPICARNLMCVGFHDTRRRKCRGYIVFLININNMSFKICRLTKTSTQINDHSIFINNI